MSPQLYPLGIQTFSKIILGGYTYVDKTAFIPRLLNAGQFIFLSRPRRFGKSLLLSTLEAYFQGRRELFAGLAIDKLEREWKKYPVLHIDLNVGNYTLEGTLPEGLDYTLSEFERAYSLPRVEASPELRFKALIKGIYEKRGEKVVILVDEYDKPLLGIEDNPALFAKNQAILKGFFGVLKSMDQYIRFAMLTGVARFNKVSIFSDLNNLNDISLDNDFAEICGWTEEELLDTFQPGIERLAATKGKGYDETVSDLRYYYDGYLFAPQGKKVYNPLSVLKALSSREIRSYWFQTGTPTFLAKRIKSKKGLSARLNSQWRLEDDLFAISMDNPDPVVLLFKLGYLTIINAESDMYELGFPNKEAKIGFAKNFSREARGLEDGWIIESMQ